MNNSNYNNPVKRSEEHDVVCMSRWGGGGDEEIRLYL